MKSTGLACNVQRKLEGLSVGEDRGIPSVEVKFVEIGWNTSGEGAYLADN